MSTLSEQISANIQYYKDLASTYSAAIKNNIISYKQYIADQAFGALVGFASRCLASITNAAVFLVAGSYACVDLMFDGISSFLPSIPFLSPSVAYLKYGLTACLLGGICFGSYVGLRKLAELAVLYGAQALLHFPSTRNSTLASPAAGLVSNNVGATHVDTSIFDNLITSARGIFNSFSRNPGTEAINNTTLLPRSNIRPGL